MEKKAGYIQGVCAMSYCHWTPAEGIGPGTVQLDRCSVIFVVGASASARGQGLGRQRAGIIAVGSMEHGISHAQVRPVRDVRAVY